MTITVEPTALPYNGDDSTVDFPITWKYFSKSDVLVTHRDANDVETTWVLDTDYTLTTAGIESGGTLTATTAPATGETIVIELDPPNTQDSALPLGGSFPSVSVEAELDQTVQRDVKIQRLFDRSLRVPTTDTQTGDLLDLPIDSDRASKFLAFDADGAPIAAAGTSADLGPVSAFVDTLLDDADADTFVQTLVADLTAETAPATDDVVLLGDTDEAKGNKMTLANALKVINALTADASPDAAADYLMTYDADAAVVKRVLIEKLIESYLSNLVRALVYNSAAQTLSTGNSTALSFDSEEYDDDGLHSGASPTRLTVPSGYNWARLFYTVSFANSATGIRRAYINKNAGVEEKYSARTSVGAASASFDTTISGATAWIPVTGGDYFELIAFQDSGGNLNTSEGLTIFGCELWK